MVHLVFIHTTIFLIIGRNVRVGRKVLEACDVMTCDVMNSGHGLLARASHHPQGPAQQEHLRGRETTRHHHRLRPRQHHQSRPQLAFVSQLLTLNETIPPPLCVFFFISVKARIFSRRFMK